MIVVSVGGTQMPVKLHGVSGDQWGNVRLFGTITGEENPTRIELLFPADEIPNVYTAISAFSGNRERQQWYEGFRWGAFFVGSIVLCAVALARIWV